MDINSIGLSWIIAEILYPIYSNEITLKDKFVLYECYRLTINCYVKSIRKRIECNQLQKYLLNILFQTWAFETLAYPISFQAVYFTKKSKIKRAKYEHNEYKQFHWNKLKVKFRINLSALGVSTFSVNEFRFEERIAIKWNFRRERK